MVKKLQKMAAKKKTASNGAFGGALPAGLLDSAIAQNVKDSAQQIWAAGLGAFSKAQGEGGKVFEALVSEGVKLAEEDPIRRRRKAQRRGQQGQRHGRRCRQQGRPAVGQAGIDF